jgi:rifampicin phosphotransferase
MNLPVVGPAAVALDGSADPAVVGGKAAALDRLVGWGLPVPAAIAATTTAYRNLVGHPELADLIAIISAGATPTAAEVDAAFAAVPLHPADAVAIVDVARDVVGDAQVAVRSSATVEDLAQSSFAGQYRSVLDVDLTDAGAVCDAVRSVFASLWHPAPVAYRAAFGIDGLDAAMAVLIQRMVPAERAGVAFTRDPIGDPSRARVEWVAGLAESLVSGQRTPTVVLLDRPGPDSGDVSITDADAVPRRALGLAMVAERRTGIAQDVEWAWDGTQVWLVQARPITTLGDEPGGEPAGDGFDDPPAMIAGADLTTAAIGESLPGVLAPLVWTTAGRLVDEAFRTLLGSLGLASGDDGDGRLLLRRVRGRAALDVGGLLTAAAGVPGAASALQAAYFGTGHHDSPAAESSQARIPAQRGPRNRVWSAVHDLRVLVTRRRAMTDAECAVAAVDALTAAGLDPESFDNTGLCALHLRLMDLAGRLLAAELGVAADAVAADTRLRSVLARHVRRSGDPSAIAERLAHQLIADAGITIAPTASASMAMLAGPTWVEAGLTPPAPARDEPRELTRRAEAAAQFVVDVMVASKWDPGSPLTGLRLRTVRRQGLNALDRLALRERTKAAVLELGGHVRRVHLECGRRLVAAGVLDEPGDVDLLAVAELRQALHGLALEGSARGEGGLSVTPAQLARRRRWLDRYGQQSGLPLHFTGGDDLPDTATATEGTSLIKGWAASPGCYTGDTVVVHRADAELPVGAVLVADATDPSWSPLFMRAGAIVLNRGGPLSHAAILARELGVPAVMNVADATVRLDGVTVTVDGDAGEVRVHDTDDRQTSAGNPTSDARDASDASDASGGEAP